MRTPSKELLNQTVTIWNTIPHNGAPINGGYESAYLCTVLHNVKYVQREGAVTAASGGAVSDTLYCMIFPNVTETVPQNKKYVSPETFDTMAESDRNNFWTIKKGEDFIALGEHNDDKPSPEGTENRNDFKVTSVDIRYNPDGSIHHFEVNAK